jgi:hypothetical protein
MKAKNGSEEKDTSYDLNAKNADFMERGEGYGTRMTQMTRIFHAACGSNLT